MTRPVSIILLVVGCILFIYGLSASESLASEVSEFFTGTPTDRAVWMLIIGAVAAVAGLIGLTRGTKT